MKDEAEIEALRDRLVALVTSDAVDSGGPTWQKLEAAETALDWVLGDADGFEGLVESLEDTDE